MIMAMMMEIQCVQYLTQMLWMILLRTKKMEVGVLHGAVLKLGAEAPHQEAPPPVEVSQLMIVPGIVQQAPPKKEAPKENAILNWAQPKKLNGKMSFWKTPQSSFCMTQ